MTIRTTLLALSLAFASPALASDPVPRGGDHAAEQGGDHGDDHAEAAHGSDHSGEHGDAHGADHDGGHGEHHDPSEYYLGDMDGDGSPNWRDASYDGESHGLYELMSNGDDPYVAIDIAFHALHIFLLLTLLYFAARRPIGDALKNRALGIRKEIVDAARERDEARQRNEELVARLGAFERELMDMRTEAAADAKRDAEHLAQRAESESQRIKESAQRSIADEVRRAKASLRKEAVDLAVQLAETTLSKQVQADDQRRLARQFLDTLKTDGDSTHG